MTAAIQTNANVIPVLLYGFQLSSGFDEKTTESDEQASQYKRLGTLDPAPLIINSPCMIDWKEDVYSVLKDADIRHLAYVPDAGHATAIRRFEADPDTSSVVLTTEEEGIGYLAGAWLGGERGALLMQSSGVGNCINTLSLNANAKFPLLMVVTMRGDWAEFNQWQNPMGQATEPALNLMGVRTWRADRPEDVAPLIKGASVMAFDGDCACAVLLGQRLIGEKTW